MKMELDSLSSLNSPVQRVGLSPKKLLSGFHHFFGKKANEYFQFLRLNLSKDLHANTDDTLKKINTIICKLFNPNVLIQKI